MKSLILQCSELEEKISYLEGVILECRDRSCEFENCVGQGEVIRKANAEIALTTAKLEKVEKKLRETEKEKQNESR